MPSHLERFDPFKSAIPCFEQEGPLFPNRPKLAELLLGGPGHDGYAYNADVYCVDCGQEIIRDLHKEGAYNNGDSGDTDEFPQPIFFGECDCAQHCAECQEYLYGEQDEDADGLDEYGNES